MMITMIAVKRIYRVCHLFLDLSEDVSDQETRLTAAEENIQGIIVLRKI